MRARLLSCFVFLPVIACSAPAVPPSADEAPPAEADAAPEPVAAPAVPKLEQLWIAEGFEQPEGIALAPDGNYFVSNVNGEETKKDGNGYISKVSPEGKIIAAHFADGLNGPKGMVVKDGVLYVSDVYAVVKVDAETGELLGSVSIPDPGFLNDMTVWGDKVLVSDSGTASIIDVSSGEPVVWLQDADKLNRVNGLLGDGDRLLIATMETGSLYSAAEDGTLTEIATGMVNADGVGLVPGGGYMLSSWPGQIHYAGEDGTVVTLLDTQEAGIMQNDLTEFGDIVISPNMAPGTVTAWKVVR